MATIASVPILQSMNLPNQNNNATLSWNGYILYFNMQRMSTEINICTGNTEIKIEGCVPAQKEEVNDGTLPIFNRSQI
jgi:hypothetical protein